MMTTRIGSAERVGAIAHTRIEDKSMINESYAVGEKIGQGTFGKVYAATHRASNGKWAIKSVNKETAGGPAIKLLEREVAILKRVKHEHIIRLNEVFETAEKTYLVTELCNGGELADELKKRGVFPEADTKSIMRKLASAISYLHRNDIVHRDLKLENILLSQNPNDPSDKLHIKVTDFGLSVVKGGAGHENMMQAFCGTPIYMSPEILDNRAYSQQCDVWAMGVIMYMLLSGKPPFFATDDDTLQELIKKGEVDFSDELWFSISEDGQNLILGMLNVDPAHRLSAPEVVDHSWFTGEKRETKNALALMKEWKDELRLDPGHTEEESDENSAINGEEGPDSTDAVPDSTDQNMLTTQTNNTEKTSKANLKVESASVKKSLTSVSTSHSSKQLLSRKNPGGLSQLSSHNISKSSPPANTSAANKLQTGKTTSQRSSAKLAPTTASPKTVTSSKTTRKK